MLKTKEAVLQEVIEAVRQLKMDTEGGERATPRDIAMGDVAQVGRCFIGLPLSRFLQLL